MFYTFTKKLQLSIVALTVLIFIGFAVPVSAQTGLNLPEPGTMVQKSSAFQPTVLVGLTLNPENPLRMDFIVQPGDVSLEGEMFEQEAQKLIEYFLVSLTVPEDEMWVNLSPYEKDRVISDGLKKTELGRDLLAQDYILKQFTASLMYPEEELGNDFWDRVYDQAKNKYGTTEIPVNTFNKVWIIPQKANVFVKGNQVFVMDNYFQVMLEEDYLALEINRDRSDHGVGKIPEGQMEEMTDVSKQVIREVLIPEIEKEVNTGKNFASLRQIFNSMILAVWYKQNLKESFLGQVYVNQKKVDGIVIEDKKFPQKIYSQYVQAFEKGVFDLIREDYDEKTQGIVLRKYVSGGISGKKLKVDEIIEAQGKDVEGRPVTVTLKVKKKDLQGKATVDGPSKKETINRKKPWEMIPSEFEELSRQGKVGPFSEVEAKSVAEGKKPIALITGREVESAKSLGLVVEKMPIYKGLSDRFETFGAYRPGNRQALVRLDNIIVKMRKERKALEDNPESYAAANLMLLRIEEGLAFGYSYEDVMSYMDHNYGHRNIIRGSIDAGKTIPQEVLAYYPDLQQKVGGIDLNAGNLDMNVTGDEIDMDFSQFKLEDHVLIEGFIPIITTVNPVIKISL